MSSVPDSPDPTRAQQPTPGPWTLLEVPSEATRLPAMLSDEERAYLYWLTREAYVGWGAVIDLGPWVGASSSALAAGLRDRKSSAKVQSFDLFEWTREYMERHLPEDLPQGADFMHVFERETAEFAPWIDAHKQDLCKASWSGSEIEILFVDAAKSWDLNEAIMRAYGPHLRPGASRVVLQDFRHPHTIWLALTFDTQPDLWEQVEAVSRGQTVTFNARRAISDDDLRSFARRIEDFDREQLVEVFERRIASEELDENKAAFRIGLIRGLMHLGACDAAAAVADELRAGHGDRYEDRVIEAVLASGYELLEGGEAGRARDVADFVAHKAADDFAARLFCAHVSEVLDDSQAALTHADEAIRLNPSNPEAHIRKSRAASKIGDATTAVTHAMAAFATMQDAKDPYLPLAAYRLEEIWNTDETWSTDTAELLVQRFADSPDVQILSAVVAFHRKTAAEAAQALESALRLDPNHARALDLRARLRRLQS